MKAKFKFTAVKSFFYGWKTKKRQLNQAKARENLKEIGKNEKLSKKGP